MRTGARLDRSSDSGSGAWIRSCGFRSQLRAGRNSSLASHYSSSSSFTARNLFAFFTFTTNSLFLSHALTWRLPSCLGPSRSFMPWALGAHLSVIQRLFFSFCLCIPLQRASVLLHTSATFCAYLALSLTLIRATSRSTLLCCCERMLGDSSTVLHRTQLCSSLELTSAHWNSGLVISHLRLHTIGVGRYSIGAPNRKILVFSSRLHLLVSHSLALQ